MSAGSDYTVGWLTWYDYANIVAAKLSQIDYPTNFEVSDDGSGSLYAEQQAVLTWAPVANGTTAAIRSILALLGFKGTCYPDGTTLQYVDIISRALDNCDNPLGGTPHYSARSDKGLLLPDTINAPRNADATISVINHTLTDNDANAPVTVTPGVPAPADADVVKERFRLGAAVIGGIDFWEIENVSINFGIEIAPKEPALGLITPFTASIITIRPQVTLQGRDLSRVQDALFKLQPPTKCSHGNLGTDPDTYFQLMQVESGANFWAPTENKHIRIAAQGIANVSNIKTGSAGGRVTNEIVVDVGVPEPQYAPFVITLDTTYTQIPAPTP